jgi:hypothetical protein
MTPFQYEQHVAEHFRLQGYTVQSTALSNDYGVDVFADRGAERLAVQVKMYGKTSRRINRDVIMRLHGAKDYFDCTRAMLVTDGTLMDDAAAVAKKLLIEVLVFQPTELPVPPTRAMVPSADREAFDSLWERYVIPLAGLVLQNSRGGTNTILRVDWSGIERTTENGRTQHISIDIFKKAVAELLLRGCVRRDYINQMYPQRASSGILLILSQVPFFEMVEKPLSLKLRATAGAEIGHLHANQDSGKSETE